VRKKKNAALKRETINASFLRNSAFPINPMGNDTEKAKTKKSNILPIGTFLSFPIRNKASIPPTITPTSENPAYLPEK
jgi:hypothetical protein